ncbi:MAG: hypothetical protein PGN34_08130 [Methylobacterium frigidaeris]
MTSHSHSSEARSAGPAPAGAGEGDRYVAALSPGLRAAYGDCLAEALPSDLAECLADLVARLDQTAAAPPCDSPLRA